MKDGVAFVDCDLVVYKCASAAQKTQVKLHIKGDEIGVFKNKTEARDFMKSEDIKEEPNCFEDIVIPDSFENAKRAAKGKIKNIVKASGCKKYRLYIDGDGNFREGVATIKPYKGNRDQPKPYHFLKLKEYVIKELGARVIEGIEADDAISIAQYVGFKKNLRYVGCTIDKDALNTPGWLYNWDKMDKPVFITEIQAARNFFKQILTGDPTDNIQGCRGVGKSSKLLAVVDELEDIDEMFDLVYDKYYTTALKKGPVSAGEDILSPLQELEQNGVLLWMMRSNKVEPYWSIKSKYTKTSPKLKAKILELEKQFCKQ